MKGSSLAVTIISPQEFDRQKVERDAKREALQQQQQQQQRLDEEQEQQVPAAAPAAAQEPVPDVFGPAEGESGDQPTYEAVDDVSQPTCNPLLRTLKPAMGIGLVGRDYSRALQTTAPLHLLPLTVLLPLAGRAYVCHS